MNRWPKFAPNTITHRAHNWLAFSGGPDSLCLLHLLIQSDFAENFTAVHVDHGLDNESGARAQRAQQLAAELSVDCRIEYLSRDELNQPGGTEAAARHARYARFQSLMSAQDHLLTAHHADDQIETMLLRLLRGSGARGVSGMQARRLLEPGWLGRPLLHWTQQQIHDYLEHHQLSAIHDPSNLDCSFDRNYLRQRVLPIVAERWPGYRDSLLQSNQLMDAAGRALEAQAAQDFHNGREMHGEEITLRLSPWLALEPLRALEVLRYWCRSQSIEPPAAARLREFLHQCRDAESDRQPTLDWAPATLRRWSNRLWLDRKPQPLSDWQIDGVFSADRRQDIRLPHDLGQLVLTNRSAFAAGDRWQVDSGKPGDRLPMQTLSRSVSEIMRSAAIPPWRRSHWPRLRINNQLIAVGDQWIASARESSLSIRWVRAEASNPDC